MYVSPDSRPACDLKAANLVKWGKIFGLHFFTLFELNREGLLHTAFFHLHLLSEDDIKRAQKYPANASPTEVLDAIMYYNWERLLSLLFRGCACANP
jgi:hypothetical protein